MEPASSLSSFSSSVSYSEADSLSTGLGFCFFAFIALEAFIAFTSFFWEDVNETDLDLGDLERPRPERLVPDEEPRALPRPRPPLEPARLPDDPLEVFLFFLAMVVERNSYLSAANGCRYTTCSRRSCHT